MLELVCSAAFGLLDFGHVCKDSLPPRCERYAKVIRAPEKARLLEAWYAGLPARMDLDQLHAALQKHMIDKDLLGLTLDLYPVELDLDVALLDLEDPDRTMAFVSVDANTGELKSASITDGTGAQFVFPAGRTDGMYGQAELKLPRSGKLGMYCYQRD
jgi:hypothetical protein